MSSIGDVHELDPIADDEERRLEDENEAEDALQFLIGGAGVVEEGTATGSTPTSPTVEASSGSGSHPDPTTRSRRMGSMTKVWLDFEELTAMEGGKEVRIAVVCHYCKQSLSAKSSTGTRHFIRHLMHCLAKKEKEKVVIVQSVLRFNTDGSVITCEYSASVARSKLCRLIAILDLPISFGESDAFQEYITRAHNPRFIK
jgi:hypothetical protein